MHKGKQIPYLIRGGIHSDHRGMLKFVNDFEPEKFKRFYVIKQSPSHGARAWQGHHTETKCFYCVSGSFAVRLVKIENRENTPVNPDILSFTLSESKSETLIIPGGYANGFKALDEDSQLLVFSAYDITEARDDEKRYDTNLWINWEEL
ncbi:MAG: dTDP-4-dehydrorhamnose 3,5-epimerase family protein [bacterium]|jgi:dTDP-4-dehydrorhamnose 3,5-epimerase-like enzyme